MLLEIQKFALVFANITQCIYKYTRAYTSRNESMNQVNQDEVFKATPVDKTQRKHERRECEEDYDLAHKAGFMIGDLRFLVDDERPIYDPNVIEDLELKLPPVCNHCGWPAQQCVCTVDIRNFHVVRGTSVAIYKQMLEELPKPPAQFVEHYKKIKERKHAAETLIKICVVCNKRNHECVCYGKMKRFNEGCREGAASANTQSQLPRQLLDDFINHMREKHRIASICKLDLYNVNMRDYIRWDIICNVLSVPCIYKRLLRSNISAMFSYVPRCMLRILRYLYGEPVNRVIDDGPISHHFDVDITGPPLTGMYGAHLLQFRLYDDSAEDDDADTAMYHAYWSREQMQERHDNECSNTISTSDDNYNCDMQSIFGITVRNMELADIYVILASLKVPKSISHYILEMIYGRYNMPFLAEKS